MNTRVAVAITIVSGIMLTACNTKTNETSVSAPTIIGTWKLLTGTIIEGGDTVVTDYTQEKSFIKVINDTHFAFLLHDLNGGMDHTAVFASGGGRYELADSLYTEYLEYCNAREWEGHDFQFVVIIRNDTLIQRGREYVEGAGVDRLNEEVYVRM